MKGKIKWFSKDKGYGFISVTDSPDHFFHVTNIVGENLPGDGDIVTFTSETRKDGKLSATNVSITQAKENKGIKYEKPYYATGDYETYSYTKEGTKHKWALLLAIIFPSASWLADGAAWWIALSAFIGFIVGGIIGKKEEKVEETYEILSTCLRCGGTGHVTARSNRKIGFQCEDCKSFWKERDKYDY